MPVSTLPFEPHPDGTCRACRGPVDPTTSLCRRCGAAHGERNRCPHCRAIARTLPHPTLLHRCSVCGKPRLPPGAQAIENPEATMQLARAGYSHRVGSVLGIASHVVLALSLGYLLLAAVILGILTPGAWVTGLALGFAVLLLFFWLFLRGRGKGSLAERERALERAYSLGILGLLRSDAVERSTEAIAQLMGLSTQRTEALLMRLNTEDQMTSRVTDDGELLFGVPQPARLRVAETPGETATNDIIDAELDATEPTNTQSRHQP